MQLMRARTARNENAATIDRLTRELKDARGKAPAAKHTSDELTIKVQICARRGRHDVLEMHWCCMRPGSEQESDLVSGSHRLARLTAPHYRSQAFSGKTLKQRLSATLSATLSASMPSPKAMKPGTNVSALFSLFCARKPAVVE